MKSRTILLMLTVTVFFSALGIVSVSADSKEAKLVREAKTTMAQARQTALAKSGGTVEFSRLERGKGGKLFFEFEIHNQQKHEVEIHIDAISGEIFSFEEESGKVSASKNAMLTGTKISMDEAEKTALGRISGAVVFAAVEKERGKILYEFEIINTSGNEVTVHVDSTSGQIESVDED